MALLAQTAHAIDYPGSVLFERLVHNATGLCVDAKRSALAPCSASSPRFFLNDTQPSVAGGYRVFLEDGYPDNCVSFTLPSASGYGGGLSVEKCSSDDPFQGIIFEDGGQAESANYSHFGSTHYNFGISNTSTPGPDGTIPVAVLVNVTDEPALAWTLFYYDFPSLPFSYFHVPAIGQPAKYAGDTCISSFGMISIGSSVQGMPCAFSAKPQWRSRIFPVDQLWSYTTDTNQLVNRYKIPALCMSANGGLCPKLPVEGKSDVCFHNCNHTDPWQKWDVLPTGEVRNQANGTCITIDPNEPISGWAASRAVLKDCSIATKFSITKFTGNPF